VERGGWREELAVQAQGQTRARLLLEAALEYARGDDLEAAARVIALAAEMGAGDLARAMWARLGTRGPAAAELAEELFQKAQAETDANTQRDLYEQLGELDRARGETSSAILWQKAILERAPSYLPALRRLEHAYLREGRTDELEPIAHTLASLLDPNEANAHAWLSARLRTKNADATGAAEMAALAAKLDPPALWALRALSVQAKDDETILDACQKLGGLVSQAREAGSLALRAAQAAVRLRRFEEAKPLLERAVEALPEHVLASHLQAAVLEALGEPAGAAEALERFANLSGVQAHRAEAWWRAAKLWQNRARDLQRAEHAFEQALASDPARTDAFEELRRVYTERGEGAKLADLLERILEETSDPAERLRLEITRARALTQASKLDLAKQALASVLEREPEHLEALDALADLCAAEGDWPGAEDAWIRLARHVQAPEEQARIYKKLGVLYDESLPHAERAELAYLEVLKRHPEDTDTVQKLVRVYGRLGKPEKAIELQNDLLNRATTNEQKRDYTIGLALVYEQVIGDRRKAEQTLERARRTWPNDGPTLRASAEFYRRGGDERALGTLIERAQGEARRALSTGRFEPSFFESLATTAELRGSSDAADLARATLAAIQGRKSELAGAGHRAGAAELDDLLAPDLLSPPLRALLKKTGDALDLAYPSDLRALRTSPVEEDSPLGESLRNLGTAFGLKIEAHVTPTLGSVCLAANASPARIVIGKALADSKDETAKTFVLIRSLKAIQSNAAAFSRTAPIELWPVLAAYLSLFSPSWTPQGVDQKKMSQAQERLKPHLGSVDSEASALAQEVIGGIGNRASQLGTAIHQWGNRTALLAIGDPNAAFRGICLASGHGTEPPSDAQERLKWVVRSAEARDLSVFSVSDAYAEVRRRLGLGRSES
jgi:tetratricopeptide (TPR) repeat protein